MNSLFTCLVFFISFLTLLPQSVGQSNRFDFNDWITGATNQLNIIGTCTLTTNVAGSLFQNSAPRYDDAGVTYSPTNGEGLALDHNWANSTTTTTVTLTFSPAISNPSFSIFDINRNNPCAAFCSSAWADRVSVNTNSGTVTATSVAAGEQTITNSGTTTVTALGNMICGGVNGAVNFQVTGSPTVITITYTSGATVDRTTAAAPNLCGAVGGETNCRNNRSACADPGRQFVTIGSVSGSTCCLGTPGQRIAPLGPVCSGTQLNFTSAPTGNNGTLSYLWNSTIPVSSGTASNFSITPLNNGTTDITTDVNLQVTSLVTAGINQGQTICPVAFTPTIRPIPTVNTPPNQSICINTLTNPVTFTGNGVVGTSFNWSNDNTAIGLAAAGTGNIAAFSIQLGVANINITPTANGCPGAPVSFTMTGIDCLLPIEWLSFAGEKEATSNRLYWTTRNEENNHYFEVEYSSNAIDFIHIGQVGSQAIEGRSNTPLSYNFNHQAPFNPIHYYRLKQVDFDGTSSYSNIISLEGSSSNDSFSCFPNPAKDELNLKITPELIGQTYQIVNGLGEYVGDGNIQSQYSVISIQNLPAGLYFLLINHGALKRTFLKN